jgi:hypothetical protein
MLRTILKVWFFLHLGSKAQDYFFPVKKTVSRCKKMGWRWYAASCVLQDNCFEPSLRRLDWEEMPMNQDPWELPGFLRSSVTLPLSGSCLCLECFSLESRPLTLFPPLRLLGVGTGVTAFRREGVGKWGREGRPPWCAPCRYYYLQRGVQCPTAQ